MSHFTVTVVTEHEPTDQSIAEALAPYHEFECTGTDDKYVQDIDITEESLKEYEEYATKDQSHREYLEGENGDEFCIPLATPQNPDKHKYGYAILDSEGNVTKVIRRTNPNSQWDWYVVGGRWSKYWTDVLGGTSDYVLKKNLSVCGTQDSAATKALVEYDRIRAVAPQGWTPFRDLLDTSTDRDQALAIYNLQPEVQAARNMDGHIWDLDTYAGGRADYEASTRTAALPTFAILHKGEWIEKGSMGWFACVSDEDQDWPATYMRVFDSIDDNYYLTCVDYHV